NETLVKRIAKLVRRSVLARELYLRELRSARGVVEALPEMRHAHLMCGNRVKRATIWNGALPTLSAWNFASTGDALGHLNKAWSGRLRDVLQPDGVFNGPRFARIECRPPHGIDCY